MRTAPGFDWRIRRTEWPEAIAAIAILALAATGIYLSTYESGDLVVLISLTLASGALGAAGIEWVARHLQVEPPGFVAGALDTAAVLSTPLAAYAMFSACRDESGRVLAALSLALAIGGGVMFVKQAKSDDKEAPIVLLLLDYGLLSASLVMTMLSIRISLDYSDDPLDGAIVTMVIGLVAVAFLINLGFAEWRWCRTDKAHSARTRKHREGKSQTR